MSVRVELTLQAKRDLAEIASYLEERAGKAIALRVVRRVRASASKLRDFPMLGQEIPDLGPGRRRLVVPPYLVIYRIADRALVRVLRVVHGARDLPALFKNDEATE